jgi:hypothetical protein
MMNTNNNMTNISNNMMNISTMSTNNMIIIDTKKNEN